MTLGWSLSFEGVLKNVIQSGWLGASTTLSLSSLKELGME